MKDVILTPYQFDKAVEYIEYGTSPLLISMMFDLTLLQARQLVDVVIKKEVIR